MSRRFLIILAVLILGFIGFVTVQGKNKDKSTTNNSGPASNHTRGEGKKGVTLVEYGDFQCNVCAAYHPIVEETLKKYGDDVKFQFISFPITQIHPNSIAAHRAAEAANKQNKFWEMYDMLYSRQQSWASSENAPQIFEDYATELSLNIDQFKNDYKSSEVVSIINADKASGDAKGVTGTPAFFLNGEKVDEPGRTVEEFSKLIDEAIKKANQTNQQDTDKKD